ncbi:ABC transporter permease [Sphaerobacter thermophilus]|uniref:ABC transporter permease n=1 Tax=Sphaerobacter thermophilus TaxID=2057 RepID=UPI000DB40D9F|nr:MAG: ABC transporter substrate-binding protein [Sphaerobacter thermophilus]
MSHYVIRRALQAIPLLIGISVIVFVLLQMTPGGPLAIAENPGGSGRVTQEQLERLRAKYGLDDPLYMRYLHWAGDLVRGDWGTSFNTGQPVLAMIGERIPATLLLTGLAFLVTLILAFPIGIISAARQYSLFDYIATTAAFLGIAVPSFWLALMFLYVFTFSLGWLPAVGLGDPRQQYEGFAAVVDRARHLIMPVSVLALVSTASLTRYVRAAMLDVLGQDYMRTARGKGLTERAALMRHALKNAAIPVVTILALEIPDLFIGSVIVESIFAISGMGRLFVESADLRDYPVLMGILLIASFLVILFNLIADILYSRLDPRIRYR